MKNALIDKKVAIHPRSHSFSDRWIEYCKNLGVPYKLVDCYSDTIIHDISDCDLLLWHFVQFNIQDLLIAQSVLRSAEAMGIKVFPDNVTCWHFDDKIAQKYLLEALGFPIVRSYVFVTRSEALRWVDSAKFPKVFKLKNGAGSSNVRMVSNRSTAKRLVRKAFSGGFPAVSPTAALQDRLWHVRRDLTLQSVINVVRGGWRLVFPNRKLATLPRQFGYVYFQDFIPGNTHDVRIIVVCDKAFGIKRGVRSGDFRASGSGEIVFEKGKIPLECVSLAFDLAERIGSKSLAVDFVYDKNYPLIVEISYSFSPLPYRKCPGYWRRNLQWIEGKFFAEDFILESLLEDLHDH